MRIGLHTLLVVAAFAVVACGTTPPGTEAREALAPTGKLRVALFEGNAVHALRDRQTGEVKGVSHDLGRQLADRLGVAFEPMFFGSLGALLDAGKSGTWDVAFLGVTADRAKFLDFTADHLEVEFGYLVPAGSSLTRIDEVDRSGVRVAVVDRGSPDLFLARELKNATLVRAAGLPAVIQLVREGRADLIAGQKPAMYGIASQLPGARVLDGCPGAEGVALAVPKGRPTAGLAFARAFLAEAKSGGAVKAAIERARLQGVVVAQTN